MAPFSPPDDVFPIPESSRQTPKRYAALFSFSLQKRFLIVKLAQPAVLGGLSDALKILAGWKKGAFCLFLPFSRIIALAGGHSALLQPAFWFI